MAGRAGAAQLSLGQLAVLGAGALFVMNPEKVLYALHRSTQAFMLPPPNGSTSQSASQPIVIHQTVPGSSSSSKTTTVIQLVIGAGCCWASYAVLVNILPDTMKGMLPVTTSTFNKAISSLGKAVINLKETLMEQVAGLSKKQDDLSEQQEETHGEVLNVKDSVSDLKEDLTLIQESLNLCHSTLSESDRRTAYIAHGVQLLTRGVSTFLPEDDVLLSELTQFNNAGDEFKNPAKLVQLRQLLRSLQKNKSEANVQAQAILLNASNSSNDPENEVPKTPDCNVERSVSEVRALLDSMRCGTVM